MRIIARCPGCGDSWLLESEAADTRIRCPECYQLFKVPKLEDVPKATEVIKEAKSSIYVDEDGKTYG